MSKAGLKITRAKDHRLGFYYMNYVSAEDTSGLHWLAAGHFTRG